MGLSTLGMPGYSWIVFLPYLSIWAVGSWLSSVTWARCKREPPIAGGKERKPRRIEWGWSRICHWMRGSASEGTQATAVWPSTLVMPHLLKSRASAVTVLEETPCKLETVVKSLTVSPINPVKMPVLCSGSCTCTSPNSCPHPEHSPGSCCAALPGPHLLPPRNAKSHTWQSSRVTYFPDVPAIPVVIHLPLPPNEGSRQWEHPKVLNPSWNTIQLPTLCEFQHQFRNFKKLLSPWAQGWDFVCCPLSKSGISKITYFHLNFTRLTCILWTSKIELGVPPKACHKEFTHF